MGRLKIHLLDTDVPGLPRAFVRQYGDLITLLLSPSEEPDEMSFQEIVKAVRRKPTKVPIHNISCGHRIETLRRQHYLSSLCHRKLVEIAAAGFFSTDVGTTLTCYHCGSHATDWLVDDCPWSRHLELQPMCPIIARHIDHNIQLPMTEMCDRGTT